MKHKFSQTHCDNCDKKFVKEEGEMLFYTVIIKSRFRLICPECFRKNIDGYKWCG